MPEQKLTLLDCTLRDGGYYNSWDFTSEFIEEYLKSMVAVKVDVVEIGFRFLSNTGFKGPCAYTTDEFLRGLDIPAELGIAVMLNAADLVGDTEIETVLATLVPETADQSPVDIVRIACHLHEFPQACTAAVWLRDRGYTVGFNLMQISDREYDEVISLAEEAVAWPIDVLYFADSTGSLSPHRISEIVSWIRERWSGEIGIHTHDNMGLALSNTLSAIDSGVTWVDSTVTGMGRGPGNARTEELVVELAERRHGAIDLVPLMGLVRKEFQPMKIRYGWGTNTYYYLAGKYGLHPTYIQEMLNDSRYEDADILAVVENLRVTGGNRFSSAQLDSARFYLEDNAFGEWSPEEMLADREVLILGSGPGARRHREALEIYIRRYNPVVLALNTQEPVSQQLINLRLASHPVRLLADSRVHAVLEQPLVTPVDSLPENVQHQLRNKTLLNYGMMIAPGHFDTFECRCVIPTSLVVAYALALSASGKASKVIIAGFDGYEPGDLRNEEMNSLLELFTAKDSHPSIISITPTIFNNLESHSVYGFIR